MNNFFYHIFIEKLSIWLVSQSHPVFSSGGQRLSKIIGKSEAIICFPAKLFDQRDKFDKNLRFEAMNQ
jgi:hypothetical protein